MIGIVYLCPINLRTLINIIKFLNIYIFIGLQILIKSFTYINAHLGTITYLILNQVQVKWLIEYFLPEFAVDCV